jgi:lipid A 3-O-deacylase PagL
VSPGTNAIIATAISMVIGVAASRAQNFDVKVFASGGASAANRHGRAILQSLNLEVTRPFGRTDGGVIIGAQQIDQPKSFFSVRGEPSDRVDGVSFSLLVRRQFATDRALQPYADFSSGPIWTERQVPAETSRVNFLTQAGGGVVLMRARFPVFVGVHVAHISNAGLSNHNPGWNLISMTMGTAVHLPSKTER